MAHARQIGTCSHKHEVSFFPIQVCLAGIIGTILLPSADMIAGPV